MRILLTGGSSFTGSWFARELSDAGHHVAATFRGSRGVAVVATPLLFMIKTASLFAAAALYRLDLRWKVTDLGFPKNYVIVARKPD